MSRKRRYLPTGSRFWGSRRGGFLAKILSTGKRILIAPIRYGTVGLYNFSQRLITRIPYFRRLQKKGKKSRLYWINVAATVCLIAIIIGALLMGGTFIVFSRDLPSPDRLIDRDISMSTKIYDRNGKLLYSIYGDINRTLITIDQVPEVMQQATVAIEDQNFYRHRGFDVRGLARAAIRTIIYRDLQGGSTITQQLVKNALLTKERTIIRKIKEFVLSLQIEARFSKDEILQMYLNETPYGGQAIGIEAAAQSYFGKSVSKLNLAEAAMLAGLPQAPSRYSPRRDPKLAKWRQAQVLRRMVEDGYITQKQVEKAEKKKLKYVPEGASIKAPHFVMYVRELLADRYGEQLVEHGGLEVKTSLNLSLHNTMQRIVREEIAAAKYLLVGNGALVVMNPKTGEILSMVGSTDYFNRKNNGNFNAALGLRQPGSSIKPITYVTAFKQGYSPALTFLDVSTSFSGGPGQPAYRPVNYDGRFRGPIQMRKALGNSINIAAVKMLRIVGVENMIATANDMGITTFDDPSKYGLALTLGGGAVKLLDMTTAFSTFATGGIRHDPVAILKVTDHNGKVLEEFRSNSGVRVLTEQQAYLISNILSDTNARLPAFGTYAASYILGIEGKTVAVKTGTSDDKRDNWAVGYTSAGAPFPVTVGVWVGNNDNSPMHPYLSSGITGAAPIFHQVMATLLARKKDVGFKRPKGIVSATIDALSGKLPGSYTGSRRRELFIAGTAPTETDDWHKQLAICKPDGKLASEACRRAGKTKKKVYIKIKALLPEWQGAVDAWVRMVYPKSKYPQYHPPTKVSTLCFDSSGNVVGDLECKPIVDITEPADGETVDQDFTVKATVVAAEDRDDLIEVRFYLDGSLWYTSTTADCGNRCYSYTFTNVSLSPPPHKIGVCATDAKGGTNESLPGVCSGAEITVTVVSGGGGFLPPPLEPPKPPHPLSSLKKKKKEEG